MPIGDGYMIRQAEVTRIATLATHGTPLSVCTILLGHFGRIFTADETIHIELFNSIQLYRMVLNRFF